MKSTLPVLSLLCLALVPVTSAAPSFLPTSVVNAASFLPPEVPGGSLAQGSMFTIFGTGLGPEVAVSATTFPLGTDLEGISISVENESKFIVAAIPLFGRGTQINAIMPSDAPLGEAMMTVTYDGESSPPVPVNIVASAVGIFTSTGIGMGPGSITNFFSATEQPLNTHHEPIEPGGFATFWVTGVAPIDAPDNLPPSQVDAVVNLRDLDVIIGDVPVTSVLYAGRSAQFPALDQVIVEVAPETPTGCYVPAVIGADGVFSNYVTLAVGTRGETCVDEDNPFSSTLTDGGIVGGFGAVRTEFNVSADLMARFTGAALGGEPLGKGLGAILAHLMKGSDETVNFKTDAVLTKFSESSGNGLAFNPVFSWAPKNVFSAAVVRGITFEDFYGGTMIPFVGSMPGSEIGTIFGRSFEPSQLSEKGGFTSWETWTSNGQGFEHFQEPALFPDVDLFNGPEPDAGDLSAFFSFLLPFVYGGSEPSPFSLATVVPNSSGLRYNWELTDPTVNLVLLWGIAQLSEEDAFAVFCGITDAELGELQAPDHVLRSVGIMPGYDMTVVGGIAAMPPLEEPGFFGFNDGKEGKALSGSVYNVALQYDF